MPGRKRAVANPLALAVLSCLREAPMHPYEMATTMRTRGKERSIKLNYGSLYTVVGNLAKHGLIAAGEAQREGRRPERTVYHLTEAGNRELEDWMAELIATPVKEYPQFEAALSELPVLPPGHAADLLAKRVAALEQTLADERAELAGFPWLPRLFLLEAEYHQAMLDAELAWTRSLLAEFEDGSFPDLGAWQHIHATGELPPEYRDNWPPDLTGQAGRREGAGSD
jgi:DNA-binding PadR family transcriptional regulator